MRLIVFAGSLAEFTRSAGDGDFKRLNTERLLSWLDFDLSSDFD